MLQSPLEMRVLDPHVSLFLLHHYYANVVVPLFVIFATPLFVLDEGGPEKFRNGGDDGVQENVNDRTHMAPSGFVAHVSKKKTCFERNQVR